MRQLSGLCKRLTIWLLVFKCCFLTSLGFQARTLRPVAPMRSLRTFSSVFWVPTGLSRQQLLPVSKNAAGCYENTRRIFYSQNVHFYRNRNHEDDDERRAMERAISFLFPKKSSRRGSRTFLAAAQDLRKEFLLWWIKVWANVKRLVRTRMERYTIYVLECEEGKYYVGSTRDRRRRFKQHCSNRGGAVFTRKYKPIRVLKEYRRVPEAYHLGMEAQVTAELMLKHGVNNVRGAMYAQPKAFTLDDLDNLVGFLGHYNDLQYRSVRNYLNHVLPPMRKNVPLKKISNDGLPFSKSAVKEDTENDVDPNRTEVFTPKPFGGSLLSYQSVPNANGSRRRRGRRGAHAKKSQKCVSRGHLAEDCPKSEDQETNGNDPENTRNGSDLP